VMKILKDTDLMPVRPVYDSVCSMVLVVRRNFYATVIERLEAIPGLAHTMLQIGD